MPGPEWTPVSGNSQTVPAGAILQVLVGVQVEQEGDVGPIYFDLAYEAAGQEAILSLPTEFRVAVPPTSCEEER